MTTMLSRLGRFAFRRRWPVLLVWAAVLAALGFASTAAADLPGDTGGMPGIEAQDALDLMRQRFPGTPVDLDRATAKVVFVAPHGKRVPPTAVEALIADVAQPATPSIVSEDGATAFTTITYPVAAADLTDATKDRLRHAVDRVRGIGLTVEVGGPVLADRPQVGGPSEIVGVVLAALVLLVTFGSVVAAGLPLLTALLGVGISMLAIGTAGAALGLSATHGTLAAMLGLAVGIDYALFVVSRYREERASGHPPHDAVGRATGTAGSAVVFAGLTVIIALSGLAAVGMPAAAKMGLTAAGAVAVAVLIALTLVPALLAFFPGAVLPRRTPVRDDNAGTRWARFVLRRPVAVLVTSVAGLVVLAIPVLHLHLGMPGDEAKSTATSERRAYDALARAFGPGAAGPLTIVVDARGTGEAAVRAVVAKVGRTPGVVAVSPPRFNPAGDTAVFTATPATAPADERTADLVKAVRAARGDAKFLVSGTTAVNIDVAERIPGALARYLAIVFGLAFVLLLVVFRSVLVPVKAVLGFLLSVLAALGVVVAVFQWGWAADLFGVAQVGPIITMMPIVLVGIVFGLAMDYEVFLVSRMREARRGGEPAGQAIVTGFRHSARVVVAAALIMIAVFAGFVGADLAMIKMIGLSLSAAILFDAFVVRMALVPAVLALLGERAWALPRWLDRLLARTDHG